MAELAESASCSIVVAAAAAAAAAAILVCCVGAGIKVMYRRLKTKIAAYRIIAEPTAIPAIAPTPRPEDDDVDVGLDDDVDDSAFVVGVVVLEGTGLVELDNAAETLGTRLGTALLKGPLVKGGKDFEGSTSRPVLRLGRGDDREGMSVREGLLEGIEEPEGDVLGS